MTCTMMQLLRTDGERHTSSEQPGLPFGALNLQSEQRLPFCKCMASIILIISIWGILRLAIVQGTCKFCNVLSAEPIHSRAEKLAAESLRALCPFDMVEQRALCAAAGKISAGALVGRDPGGEREIAARVKREGEHWNALALGLDKPISAGCIYLARDTLCTSLQPMSREK